MRYLKAVKIFDGARFLEEGTVLAYSEEGRLLEIIGPGAAPSAAAEHFEGILCPGFVNAHCHLELSHLKGLVAPGTGFAGFALDLVKKRSSVSAEQRLQSMRSAAEEMERNGIAAVGDISNTAESAEVKAGSALYFHTFVELIALNPANAARVFGHGRDLLMQFRGMNLSASLAAHAPYTVSAELLDRILQYDRDNDLPFSIHNQESVEEHLFFMGRQSGIHDLYAGLGIDISWFRPPQRSSLGTYASKLRGSKAMLVHNTFSEPSDIALANAQGAYWCFCPNANLYIEGRLPDFGAFAQKPERLCIGTDSLASNVALDVLSELNLVARSRVYTVEQLLAMVCRNGAEALGRGALHGRLAPGTSAGLNLVHFDGTEFELRKRIF